MSEPKEPMDILRDMGAKISPTLTRPGPLEINSRSCVICSALNPGEDCICHTIEFGSDEYFARLDRLHGRNKSDG
jgi:hypothetical protein